MNPLVGIIMGSQSDWETLQPAAQLLEQLGVPHEVKVVSAHARRICCSTMRQRPKAADLPRSLPALAAQQLLPGMAAAKTRVPVLGVPVQSKGAQRHGLIALDRADAKGVPVATFAIGAAGAANAGLFAAAIVALHDPRVAAALTAYRQAQTDAVLAQPDPRKPA